MKKRIITVLLLLLFVLILSACGETNGVESAGGGNGNSAQTTASAKVTEHDSLQQRMRSVDFNMEYSELYSLYSEAVAHVADHKCNLTFRTLLETMLYGNWTDSDGYYISYQYVYKNYNNTEGSTWYSTNLKTSKVDGNSYYYYTNANGTSLVIGYEDKITNDQTDNFVIDFYEDHITVKNKNNDTEYRLDRDHTFEAVVKGNAKLAYVYLAKKVFSFKYPASVQVTSCYVDCKTKIVYVTIQATNGFGGTNNTKYKLYEQNGQYFIEEYSHSQPTNVDLEELNQKIQAYVATGG